MANIRSDEYRLHIRHISVGKVANHTTLPWVFVTGGVREAYTRRKDNKLIRGSEKNNFKIPSMCNAERE
jgi:hypothetical protein